jgi:hypothetical protein
MMAAQYRADAASFVDKQQLLNEMWSVDGKPSCNLILPIECAPIENPLKVQYVRGGAVPTGQDAKLYDLAKVTVGSYGSQATAVVGELWVSYEVVLRKPQLTEALDFYGLTSHHALVSADGTNSMGTSRSSIFDNIGMSFSGTDTFVWPVGCQGNFMITYTLSGVAVVGGGVPTYTKTNCSFPTFLFNCTSLTSSSYATQGGSAGLTNYLFIFVINITDPTKQASVRITAGSFPTASAGDLIVTQIPVGFV